MRDWHFACRQCHNLTYRSTLLSGEYKKYGRALAPGELDKIASKAKRREYNGKVTKQYPRFIKSIERQEAILKAKPGVTK